MTVERPDGTQIVEHADGTRITTFYQQIQREFQPADEETGEEAQFSLIMTKFVKVECAGFATVVFDSDLGSCESVFGNGTVVTTQANGAAQMRKPDHSLIQIDTKGICQFLFCLDSLYDVGLKTSTTNHCNFHGKTDQSHHDKSDQSKPRPDA